MDISIWNPTKNEDYIFNLHGDDRGSFSSLNNDLYVIEAVGEADDDNKYLESIIGLLKHSVELSVVLTPWLSKKNYQQQLKGLLDLDYSRYNFFGHAKNHLDLGEKLLAARSNLGGDDSGEWIFIGTKNPLILSDKEVNDGFSSLLKYDFDFILYMAEMHQIFLLFKNQETLVSNMSLLDKS